MTAFLKMHGLGNDFIVFDARRERLALDGASAKALADRRLGVGCDQVIVIGEGGNGIDAAMRIFNADGAEVESCGNAARCVARLLMEERDVSHVTIDTPGGRLACDDAGAGNITIDMGAPRFAWDEIPLSRPEDTNDFVIELGQESLRVAAVNVGNPHCVLFEANADTAPVARLGPRIEAHPLFPQRTNVEFVTVRTRGRLRMRVWERGAGITSACGTGACAAVAAARRRGLVDRRVEVMLDGGPLAIELRESDNHILMTGPAALAFRGEVDLGAYAS